MPLPPVVLMDPAIDIERIIGQDGSVIEGVRQGKPEELARFFLMVTVVAARQSGETTLSRTAFPRHRQASLAAAHVLEFARSNRRGFLAPLRGGRWRMR